MKSISVMHTPLPLKGSSHGITPCIKNCYCFGEYSLEWGEIPHMAMLKAYSESIISIY